MARRVLGTIGEAEPTRHMETLMLQEIQSTLTELKLSIPWRSGEHKQDEILADLKSVRRELQDMRSELHVMRMGVSTATTGRRHSFTVMPRSPQIRRSKLGINTVTGSSTAADAAKPRPLAATPGVTASSSHGGSHGGSSTNIAAAGEAEEEVLRKGLADGPSERPQDVAGDPPPTDDDNEQIVTLQMGSVIYQTGSIDAQAFESTGMSPHTKDDSGSAMIKRIATVGSRLRELEGNNWVPDEWRSRPESWLADTIQGNVFLAICSFFIVLNTIFIGVSTEYNIRTAMRKESLDDPLWVRYISRTFTVIFTLEILVRLCAERLAFFLGTNRSWNAFDGLCITSAWAEEFASIFNMSFMRLLRVLRMARIVRIVRVFRFFHELRLMVCSVFASVASLVWAMLLLVLTMYLFAILFTQATAAHIAEDPYGVGHEGLEVWYSGLLQTMYTLLLAVSGGRDWSDLVAPLSHISYIYSALFVMHTLFVVFGMMNVLTGIFVDRAQELNQLDRDLVIQAEEERVGQFYKDMKDMFLEADSEKTGKIAWPRFKAYLDRPDVQYYFRSLQLDVSEAKDLFRLLDVGSKGQVSIEEFVFGCMRVKGQAKNLDVLRMQKTLQKLGVEIQQIRYTLNQFVPVQEDPPVSLQGSLA